MNLLGIHGTEFTACIPTIEAMMLARACVASANILSNSCVPDNHFTVELESPPAESLARYFETLAAMFEAVVLADDLLLEVPGRTSDTFTLDKLRNGTLGQEDKPQPAKPQAPATPTTPTTPTTPQTPASTDSQDEYPADGVELLAAFPTGAVVWLPRHALLDAEAACRLALSHALLADDQVGEEGDLAALAEVFDQGWTASWAAHVTTDPQAARQFHKALLRAEGGGRWPDVISLLDEASKLAA